MNKKVCKKEISVLLVLYLIILNHLIRKQESVFSLYPIYLITFFSTQKETKSQSRSKKTPDNVNKDFYIYGKESINESKTANLRSGNYYYNARWYFRNSLNNNPPETSNAHTSCEYLAYNPILGRFITEDPVRDGPNWYSYVENDPVNFTDPLG